MTVDMTPSNLRRVPSVWEDIPDVENWFATIPAYGAMSGLSISEDGKQWYVEASVPGVDPKDIDVTFHKGVLWIKGEAKKEEREKKYYRKATSAFSYRIAVPDAVDQSVEPQAECNNSVMRVTFAKVPTTQPKKITVKTLGNGKKTTVKK